MTDTDPRREALMEVLDPWHVYDGEDGDRRLRARTPAELADAVLSVLPECRCQQLERVGWWWPNCLYPSGDNIDRWGPEVGGEPVYRCRPAAALSHTEQMDALRSLVAELTDPDVCGYDHHGCCQTHSLDPRPCPHERAQELLAASFPYTEEPAGTEEQP